MKHNLKITIILLVMFLITQLIGLAVINAYSTQKLPYNLQPPEEMKPHCPITLPLFKLIKCYLMSMLPFIIVFSVAIFLILLLMKMKTVWLFRVWFFLVSLVAIAITINSIFLRIDNSSLIALMIALPLSFYKVFKRNLFIHNLTELLIYPGIAAIFVPILNLWAIILLLLLISVYDIYAVWHSGFMQKMAKFQVNQVKVFAGFFVPYLSRKQRKVIKTLKQKYKAKKAKEKLKEKKIKVNLAILGGGDVVFPIIFAGVVLKTLGFLPAINITIFSTLALFILFVAAKKGKFYPAMPFLTAGCLVGLLVGYIISFILTL